MAVYKDGNIGKWRAVFRFTDWKGGTEADTKERFCDQTGSSELGAGNYAETGSKT